MNRVTLMGRLTKDPEIRYTQGEKPLAIARYTLAVDKKLKPKEGEPSADFINCIAFGKTAEITEKYLKKGAKVGIDGRIQTGSYTNKEGQKVYTFEVAVESMDFCDSKSGASNLQAVPNCLNNKASNTFDGFIDIPEGFEEDLPFV